MPEMDGLALTQYIKKSPQYQHLPIFMITSRSTDLYKTQAEALGVDEFISKPFDSTLLEKKITKALHDKMSLVPQTST
jgi:CheY-like chemotaxis protein